MCTGGELAQMVERPLRMREVPGSIPGFSKISFYYNKIKLLLVGSRIFISSILVLVCGIIRLCKPSSLLPNQKSNF